MATTAFLQIFDAKGMPSFYRLEEWELIAFVQLAQDDPREGFCWLAENCSNNWLPSIRLCHKGEHVFRYDVRNPRTLCELLDELEWVFPS